MTSQFKLRNNLGKVSSIYYYKGSNKASLVLFYGKENRTLVLKFEKIVLYLMFS